MAGELRRLTRKARRQTFKGDRTEVTTKRLATNHGASKSIVANRERWAREH